MAGDLRLAVFDCDGTLVDSQRIIVDAMTEAWSQAGIGTPDAAAVRQVVGLSLVEAMAELLPDGQEALWRDLAELYKQSYYRLRQVVDSEPLYDGVPEMLDQLDARGILLGIATGKSRRGLDAVLDAHGLTGRFVTLQTSDQGPGKPHPAMLLRALGEGGVEADAAVMIGDTSFDMQMARAAKVASIGVAWGYHLTDELTAAGADQIVTVVPDLAATVLARLG